MKVLYEDNHLLVVDKPAGLVTMGAESGEDSVHSWAAAYLKDKYNKPGNVFVGVVSRLDAVTSGVLVLARTSKAASRLSIQFGGPGKSKKVSRRAEKIYLAIISGNPLKESGWARSGKLVDHVWKDESSRRMRVARGPRDDSQEARLSYCVLAEDDHRSLVAVKLDTGRKHQIRLQLADRGHPIIGDEKYGSRERFPQGVALHSARLSITHPTTEAELRFIAEPPECWGGKFAELPNAAAIAALSLS